MNQSLNTKIARPQIIKGSVEIIVTFHGTKNVLIVCAPARGPAHAFFVLWSFFCSRSWVTGTCKMRAKRRLSQVELSFPWLFFRVQFHRVATWCFFLLLLLHHLLYLYLLSYLSFYNFCVKTKDKA